MEKRAFSVVDRGRSRIFGKRQEIRWVINLLIVNMTVSDDSDNSIESIF